MIKNKSNQLWLIEKEVSHLFSFSGLKELLVFYFLMPLSPSQFEATSNLKCSGSLSVTISRQNPFLDILPGPDRRHPFIISVSRGSLLRCWGSVRHLKRSGDGRWWGGVSGGVPLLTCFPVGWSVSGWVQVSGWQWRGVFGEEEDVSNPPTNAESFTF